MKHLMPTLPYDTEALQPALSKESFDYHYGKHLQTYVDNLNKLITGTEFEDMPVEEIIRKADGAIYNNAAQTWNHTMFFDTLTPVKKEMPERLAGMIDRDFGSAAQFRDEFLAKAAAQFGSGWAWLSVNGEGKLVITTESNAGNPLRGGLRPIMTIDVWEHAYYIDYRNRRPDFLKVVWELIDWEKVDGRL